MELDEDQKCIFTIDCWKVHTSQRFRDFLKENYPWILLIYVPACCTRKCQPADLAANRVRKAHGVNAFQKMMSKVVTEQLREGVVPSEMKIDLRMVTLRPHIPSMLHAGFKRRVDHPEMISKGWEKAALLRAWDSDFQPEAVAVAPTLFKDPAAAEEFVV